MVVIKDFGVEKLCLLAFERFDQKRKPDIGPSLSQLRI
jgi:hypothetical protein